MTQDDAICEAVGLDHVVLQVPDLEKSAVYYRKFFGMETSRDRTPERIWFTAARTRLGLEKMGDGQMPHIDRFGIRVAAFDRQAVTRKLGAIGVTRTAVHRWECAAFPRCRWDRGRAAGGVGVMSG